MSFQIFASGILMLGLGVLAMSRMEGKLALELLEGSLLLGGGLIICGLFSLKMRWHGLIGAGVLGLLGAARGLGNLPGLVRWLGGDQSRDIAPLIELIFTVLCLVLLMRVLKVLRQERTRRLLQEDSPQDSE